MIESFNLSPMTKGELSAIVLNKSWYGFNQTTGAFDWKRSVTEMACILGLNFIQVGDMMTNAFTHGCLSRVRRKTDSGGEEKVSLLEAIEELGLKPYVWTVGDLTWQRTKFERSGAKPFIDDDHYHCSKANKMEDLKKIISNFMADGGRKRVIVVDDKRENIDKVYQLARDQKWKEVEVMGYHMKLDNSQADPTAFYQWLLKQRREAEEKGQSIELVLDFDGVVANTDEVLRGPFVDKLWEIVQGEGFPAKRD